MKLFDKIKDVVENKSHLVCVLIDEVESIAFARNSSGKFTETKTLWLFIYLENNYFSK